MNVMLIDSEGKRPTLFPGPRMALIPASFQSGEFTTLLREPTLAGVRVRDSDELVVGS